MNPAELIAVAASARQRAYAPYSKYFVGAALRSEDGRVFPGCNVENAAYGSTLCAERVAVVSAIAVGARRFTELALVTEGGAAPCGACRQVLHEFAPSLTIHIADAQGRSTTTTLDVLLPRSFGPADLRGDQFEEAS